MTRLINWSALICCLIAIAMKIYIHELEVAFLWAIICCHQAKDVIRIEAEYHND